MKEKVKVLVELEIEDNSEEIDNGYLFDEHPLSIEFLRASAKIAIENAIVHAIDEGCRHPLSIYTTISEPTFRLLSPNEGILQVVWETNPV